MQNDSIYITPGDESKRVWKTQRSLYAGLVVTFTGILILSIVSSEFIFYFILACAAAMGGFAFAAKTLKDEGTIENLDLYTNIVNSNSSSAYMVYNVNSRQLQFSSNSIYNVIGYTPFEMMNKSNLFFVDEKVKADIFDLMEEHKNWNGKVLEMTVRAKHKNGNYLWIDLEATVICREEHNKSYSLVTIKDVSDLKAKEHTTELYIKELEQLLKQDKKLEEKLKGQPQAGVVNAALQQKGRAGSDSIIGRPSLEQDSNSRERPLPLS